VNNSTVFRDASLHSDGAHRVLDAISSNFDPAVVGYGCDIRRIRSADAGGAIVNVCPY
jgi:hypothetical protein